MIDGCNTSERSPNKVELKKKKSCPIYPSKNNSSKTFVHDMHVNKDGKRDDDDDDDDEIGETESNRTDFCLSYFFYPEDQKKMSSVE
jgi:hypothetical protein